MSNEGKFHDKSGFLRSAGNTSAVSGLSADNSIRQDLYFQPRTSTPEEIKKYRRSTREVPGIKQLHHGIYDDPKDHEKLIHGVKTLGSDHVNDCIKGQNLNGINYFLNKIKEDKYAKNQREPLGNSIRRNYVFPEETSKQDFKFGVPTIGFYNAKDLIYTQVNLEEKEPVKKLYQKTHGLSDPGEQKDRNYNWPVDKHNHVFGKTEPIEYEGTKKCLNSDFLEANYPKTKIVSKRLEDFRQATSDVVGRSKFKGTLSEKIEPNHSFGVKSLLGNNWNVAKCINGDPQTSNEKFLTPDPDLGKSMLYRNKLRSMQPKELEKGKTFGVPTIREDLKEKEKKSVTNITNYGNEKDVYELLYPNQHCFKGLDDPDFEKRLDRESLNKMLLNQNYQFPEDEFNLLFSLAFKKNPCNEEKITLKAFFDVVRSLKREYLKYRTLFK